LRSYGIVIATSNPPVSSDCAFIANAS
jgi:hypothetical protein